MGNELKLDDQPFQHYTARHRVEAWISQSLFDRFVYTVRRGLLKGMKRRGGLAWIPEFFTNETPEIRFWRTLNFAGLVVYDVGAFHGLLSLYFAKTAKHVVCFEPSSRNRQRLEENLRLNRLTNVSAYPFGLGAESARCELVASVLMPGGGSLEPKIARRTRHGTAPTRVETIDVRPFDEIVRELDLPTPDFIKIDVEGFEAEVLRGGRELLKAGRPRLFLEMHGETMNEKRQKVAEIVQLLVELGYESIQHVETGTSIHVDNSDLAARGHLYAFAREV